MGRMTSARRNHLGAFDGRELDSFAEQGAYQGFLKKENGRFFDKSA